MSKFALVVELTTAPGRRDEFVALACRHAETTLANDSDCLRDDVLVPQDSRDLVLLYELYASQEAADAHVAAAHTAQYVEDSKEMIVKRPRRACALANA